MVLFFREICDCRVRGRGRYATGSQLATPNQSTPSQFRLGILRCCRWGYFLANIYWRNLPSIYLENNTLPNDVVTLVVNHSGETVEELIMK